jgi:hypothetical protein
MSIILKKEKKNFYGRPDDIFQEKFRCPPIELITSGFAEYLSAWMILQTE